jgi:hypothetical protein
LIRFNSWFSGAMRVPESLRHEELKTRQLESHFSRVFERVNLFV